MGINHFNAYTIIEEGKLVTDEWGISVYKWQPVLEAWADIHLLPNITTTRRAGCYRVNIRSGELKKHRDKCLRLAWKQLFLYPHVNMEVTKHYVCFPLCFLIAPSYSRPF